MGPKRGIYYEMKFYTELQIEGEKIISFVIHVTENTQTVQFSPSAFVLLPNFPFLRNCVFQFSCAIARLSKKTGAPTSPRKRISQVETVAFDILFLFLYLVLIEHSSLCQETFQHFTPFRQ